MAGTSIQKILFKFQEKYIQKKTIPSNNVVTNRSNVLNISLFIEVSLESLELNNNYRRVIKNDEKEQNIFSQISKIEENKSDIKFLYENTSKKS